MPLTKVYAPKHLPSQKVKLLCDAVHEALISTCAVPINDVFQLISRFEPDEIILDPHFGNVNRSSDASVVEILYLVGRTDDQKRSLFRNISDKAVQIGFRSDDITIALIENTRMDWSLGNGVAYADIHTK